MRSPPPHSPFADVPKANNPLSERLEPPASLRSHWIAHVDVCLDLDVEQELGPPDDEATTGECQSVWERSWPGHQGGVLRTHAEVEVVARVVGGGGRPWRRRRWWWRRCSGFRWCHRVGNGGVIFCVFSKFSLYNFFVSIIQRIFGFNFNSN